MFQEHLGITGGKKHQIDQTNGLVHGEELLDSPRRHHRRAGDGITVNPGRDRWESDGLQIMRDRQAQRIEITRRQ